MRPVGDCIAMESPRLALVFVVVVAAAAVAVAGCGSSSSPPAMPSVTERPAADVTESRADGPTVTTHGSQYGRILSDGRGRALYVFTRETTSSSRCYGARARAWPPFRETSKIFPSGMVPA